MSHAGFPHPPQPPAPAPSPPTGGTEELISGELNTLAQAEAQRDALEARLINSDSPDSGFFSDAPVLNPLTRLPTGETEFRLDEQKVEAANAQLALLNVQIERLTGAPPRGGVSTANAQIAAQSQRERLAFDREQAGQRAGEFETTERRAGEQFASETSRLKTNTRIDTAIDMLEQSVSRGEIGRAEADRRLRAAMDAASLQRDVLSDFGGFNLPAGSEFFPNLGPESAFGGIFQGLTGQPFQGLETGGTFGVNPTALAQSVQQAGQGSVLPQLDIDIARARAEVAAAQALTGSPIPATQPATQPRISPPAAQNRRLAF